MALTEYEERVIAELEAQLRPDDTVWFERFDANSAPGPGGKTGRIASPLACLLGGVALLLAVRHSWFLVKLSNISGFPSSSITRGLGVIGCVMVLGSALMLWRLVRDLPRHTR
jgi:hypothetical protein